MGSEGAVRGGGHGARGVVCDGGHLPAGTAQPPLGVVERGGALVCWPVSVGACTLKREASVEWGGCGAGGGAFA